jgi:hypothetical protein
MNGFSPPIKKKTPESYLTPLTCEGTARRQSFMKQEERSHQEPNLLTP